MNHVHGAIKVGTDTVVASNECSGVIISITVVAVVIAAIMAGIVCFNNIKLGGTSSDTNT